MRKARRSRVLGQTVRITAATVVDGASGGAGSLAVGDIVEVHGFSRRLDGYVATRIERRSTAPAAFRVRGLVRDLAAARHAAHRHADLRPDRHRRAGGSGQRPVRAHDAWPRRKWRAAGR